MVCTMVETEVWIGGWRSCHFPLARFLDFGSREPPSISPKTRKRPCCTLAIVGKAMRDSADGMFCGGFVPWHGTLRVVLWRPARLMGWTKIGGACHGRLGFCYWSLIYYWFPTSARALRTGVWRSSCIRMGCGIWAQVLLLSTQHAHMRGRISTVVNLQLRRACSSRDVRNVL